MQQRSDTHNRISCILLWQDCTHSNLKESDLVAATAFNTVVFDIGGSHASASLVRDEKLELHRISACALNPGASKEELLGALEQLARTVLAESGVALSDLTGIGFAIPGPF